LWPLGMNALMMSAFVCALLVARYRQQILPRSHRAQRLDCGLHEFGIRLLTCCLKQLRRVSGDQVGLQDHPLHMYVAAVLVNGRQIADSALALRCHHTNRLDL